MISRQIKRTIVTMVGGAILLIGVILSLPLVPGPGLLVAALGLAILATEYTWARRHLDTLKQKLRETKERLQGPDSPGK